MISDRIKITLLNLKKVANSKIHWYVNDFLEDRKGKSASWIHIYEGERGKQILVIDVDSSSHSDSVYLGMMRSLSACLQEKKSSDQTSWRNIVFVRSQEEEFETKREGERMARRSGPISLSLSLPFESLGFNTWNRSRETAAENNSVPEIFGNVAIVGNLNSRGGIDWEADQSRSKSREGKVRSENNPREI